MAESFPRKDSCRVNFHRQNNGETSDGEVVTISSPSDLPLAALAAWRELPETVRDDPVLSPFRRGYERRMAAHPGPSHATQPPLAPDDPEHGLTAEFSRNSLSVDTSQVLETSQSKEASADRERLAGLLTCSDLVKHQGIDKKNDNEDHHQDKNCTESSESRKIKCAWRQYIKVTLLVIIWILFTIILMTQSEKQINMHQVSIPENSTRIYWIFDQPLNEQLSVKIQGAFLPIYYSNMSTKKLNVWVEVLEYFHIHQLFQNHSTFHQKHVSFSHNLSDEWHVPLVSSKELIDIVPEVSSSKTFLLKETNLSKRDPEKLVARLLMTTNMDASLPISLSYDISPIDTYRGQIYGGLVLIGLYVLIVTEAMHRALAAMLASTMSVAILAAMNERPSLQELFSWIDVETLLLLFSMMVLVAILADTGLFDFLAVLAYQITNGRVWPLVNTLSLFTAVLSSFLDNVTTVLLMTPVTIRLCEVTELNPVPILMAMTMYSNIGGALTPVGDPPNAIIASHPDIREAGVDFGVFSLHMSIGVVVALLLLNLYLRIRFRNIGDLRFTEPQDIQELRHEIAIWQRAAASLSTFSKDEEIVRRILLLRVNKLRDDLKDKVTSGSVEIETYRATLEELKAKYPIRDKVLLAKSGVALLFVILLFFLHSIPQLKLSLGWTALLGASLLLILTADNEIMESVLNRIEWGTLLFFAALFVLMEALSRLGLIELVGWVTKSFVLLLPEHFRLSGAIVFILVISAVASTCVDNIPLTTMMVRIITSMSQNSDIGLPLQPLVWALAFGACLGGNGTLIGSSANMVCAGVAEQHGYKFTFLQYLRLGIPVTFITVIGAAVYLLLAHVLFSWHP